MGDTLIKRVHGIVPVDEDGSAVFNVPAGKNLYFQALDANAPYYGIYEGKKNIKWKDAPDFRPFPDLVEQRC